MPAPELTVVVPICDEEEGLKPLYDRLTAALAGVDYELLLVNDGSRDRSFERMLALHASDGRVSVLDLSRNFGHQVAITAGMDHARGDAVVVMDADLQDPPEVVVLMLAKYREGFDVVYGVRENREAESAFKRATAWVFYRLMRLLTPMDLPPDSGDFRLLSRRAVDAVRQLREQSRFVRGMVRWIGFKQTALAYRREARVTGQTKYPLWKMVRLAVDAMISFSTIPLRVATALGLAVAAGCVSYAVYAVTMKVFTGHTVQGWASLMVAILLVGSAQLVCLGILGEYVGRIYDEVRARPLYLVGALHRREPK
jgi:glycosyltransferase involved in cell wall biosynthesis